MLLEASFQLLALFIFAGTFITLLRDDSWMIRGWDFLRIQLFFIGILTAIGLGFFSFNDGEWGRDLIILLALAAAILAMAFWLWPYTRLHKKEVLDGSGENGIKLLVSNVLMTNRDSKLLLALIHEHEPDVIIALETDQWWVDQFSTLQKDYPHAVEVPQPDTYGMLVRSRLPLIDTEIEYIIRKNIPSIHTSVELSDKTKVRIHALHPKPPFPDEDTTSTDRDAELLIVGKRVKECDTPTLVLGDMNDVAWSSTTKLFKKISGLLDPRVGRGFFSSYHACHWFLRWPLDHVFISDHFRVRNLSRLPFIDSDHFPILVDFSFEPEGQSEQEEHSADGEDIKEAEEKISKAADSPKDFS